MSVAAVAIENYPYMTREPAPVETAQQSSLIYPVENSECHRLGMLIPLGWWSYGFPGPNLILCWMMEQFALGRMQLPAAV